MKNNKLMIAAAGSGKTTYLVRRALRDSSKRVLITAYTEANEDVIREAIVRSHGYIPANITVQTWFTFLLQHGVRPFQSSLDASIHETVIGFCLSSNKSGQKHKADGTPLVWKSRPIFWGEADFQKYYFTNSFRIYSDKISKFVYQCNSKTNGDVVSRIERIFDCVLVDEVQDLAGYDLELLKLLFQSEPEVLLVGDPRQVTYLTHHSSKHSKYKNGNIKGFIEEKLGKKMTCSVDETTLSNSHRNNRAICEFSSTLFPALPTSMPCTCEKCRNKNFKHEGIFWIARNDVEKYLELFRPVQLRWNVNTVCSDRCAAMNFGESKGQSFDRVLVYPTDEMKKWLFQDRNHALKDGARSKLYVAITRARYSVAFVLESKDASSIADIAKYSCDGERAGDCEHDKCE